MPHPHRSSAARRATLLAASLLIACSGQNLVDLLENPGKNTGKACGQNCRIFLTAIGYTGLLGGSSGADARCLADPANPRGPGRGLWKAMLVDNNRRACTSLNCQVGGASENSNWVLRPSTPYFRPTGELIAVTNPAGIFVFDTNLAIATIYTGVWTGLNSTWQNAAVDCNNWNSDSFGDSGHSGRANSTNVDMVYNASSACSLNLQLYCVEQ